MISRQTVVSDGGTAYYALLQIGCDTPRAYPIESEFITLGRGGEHSPPSRRPMVTLEDMPDTVSRKHIALTHVGRKFILHNIGMNSVTIMPPAGPPKKLQGGGAHAEERARRLQAPGQDSSAEIEVGTIIELGESGPRFILAARR